MRALHVIVLAALVSIACSALTVLLYSNRSPEAAAGAARPPTDNDFASAIEALRREQAAMQDSLAELRSATHRAPADVPTRTAASALSAEDVERIVARALGERGADPKPPIASAAEIAAAMQRLFATNLTEDERIALWDELAAKGMLDAVVAEYERRVAAAPGDSTASTELGFAYLQEMRHAGSGPERGKWGQKGSEAYARALELDESNWEARFAQAQHFWYADMPGDALRHLQILRDQQKSRRPEARHAQAYVLLGNMHMDQGRADEAKQVWSEGLLLFPTDARLRELVEAAR